MLVPPRVEAVHEGEATSQPAPASSRRRSSTTSDRSDRSITFNVTLQEESKNAKEGFLKRLTSSFVHEPGEGFDEAAMERWNEMMLKVRGSTGTLEDDSDPAKAFKRGDTTWLNMPKRDKTEDRFRHLEQSRCRSLRVAAAMVLESEAFDFIMVMIILANAVTIGVEQSVRVNGGDKGPENTLAIMENIFLVIYTFEIALRFFVLGIRAVCDHWVKFDLVLVVLGWLVVWILPLASVAMGDESSSFLTLRTLRLLRLARTARLLTRMQELWMLVQMVTSCASTMVYTLLLLLTVLYLFSIVGVEVITNHELAKQAPTDELSELFYAVANEHFGNLFLTMITLVQFVTLDSMANMYKPLVKADWRLAFYFIGMVLAISIVLMNLITAVIVNSALEQASNNKEIQRVQENKRRKKTIEELRNMFSRLDHDGSGTITLAEIMEATEEDQIMLKKFLTLDSPLEIFCMLDIDNSGQLNIEEFCEGVMEHVTSDRSVEFKRIDKNFKQLRKEVRELQLSVDKVASIALKASGSGTGSQQLSPVALTKKKRDVKFNEEKDQNEMPRDSEPVTEPEPPEPQQPTAEPASESPLWATDMMNLLREELAHEFWQVRSDLARGMAVAAQQAAAYAQERPLDLLSELNQEVSKLKLPWPPRQCESARQIERDRGKPSWQWPEGKTPHVAVAGSKWSSAIPSRSAPAMPPAPAPDNDSPRLDVGPWS